MTQKFKKTRKPFSKLPPGELKLYLARFTNKSTGEVDFYKFGYTSFHDAADRFLYEPEQYEKWSIVIMKTVWGPEEDILRLEEEYKERYPKTFWIEEKIGGVTEICKLSFEQIKTITTEFEFLSTGFYQQRAKARAISQRDYNLYG